MLESGTKPHLVKDISIHNRFEGDGNILQIYWL